MADAPFDAYLNTPNKSVRQNVPRKGVVLHHAAMLSLSGLERLAMGAKQVSATAIAKDRVSIRLMSDAYRAWSLSSAWGDSAFRSVETCNQSTDGWTISDESHWELAHLVAYWATIDGFWPHRDGAPKTWTVLGHREMYTIWDVSYGTACPGGMNLGLVTRRAQQLLKGTAPAGQNARLIPMEDTMTLIIKATVDGTGELAWIKKDMHFADTFTAPLTVLTAAEVGALEYWKSRGIPYRLAEWKPADIKALVLARGVHPIGGGAGRTDYSKTVF